MYHEMCYLHKTYWKFSQTIEMRLFLYCLATSQYIRRLYKSALNTLPSSMRFAVCYRETCWTVTSAFPVSKDRQNSKRTARTARDTHFCLTLLVHKPVLQLSGVRPLCGSPSVSCPANRRQALPLEFSRQHQFAPIHEHSWLRQHFFLYRRRNPNNNFYHPKDPPPPMKLLLKFYTGAGLGWGWGGVGVGMEIT